MSKTKNSLKIFFLLISLVLIASCSSSLIYSPSLGLSDKKLHENEVYLNGGLSLLPETRPHEGDNNSFGGYLMLGYGFSDNFNLYLTGWNDFYLYSRAGTSLHSRITLKTFENAQLEIIPRFALLFDGNALEGTGFTLPILLMYNLNETFYTFSGVAPTIGAQYWYDFVNNPYGYGVIGHFGLGYNINSAFSLVFEINPIYHYNRYDVRNDFLVAPTLSLSYRFKH